jgi:PAS domain S-box-containing protein
VENAVSDSSDLHEFLVQNVVDYAIYMIDLNGNVASWNIGGERIKGYTRSEIIGQPFAKFYTPEDQAAGRPARALKLAAEHGHYAAEGWRVRKDGTRIWASVVIDALRRDGKLVGFAKITRDMTAAHAAQLAALESERRFRLLVEGVTDYSIFMLDTEGIVVNWNAGARRIKGFQADEIVGHHFSRFYTPEDRSAGMPHTALETARREGRYAAEGWRVRKDGSLFWASVVIDAIYDDGVLVGFAKITRDMTELREAREQLAQAQKMEAIGQLTGGLAHDFNNLLTGIMGSLDLIEARLAQGRLRDLDKYVLTAKGATKRAASLTHRLLAFSRRQTLDSKVTDANRLISGMADFVRRSVGPAVEVEIVLAAGLWSSLIDENQLENAILNLCINARDAMPDGGRLTIESANRWLDARTARERDIPPGQYVSICVSDTGTGMTPETIARAFEPFYTTKPLGEGTGLGLSMVYGFARQSGGQVRIYSEVRQGTMVCLYLPRHLGEDSAEDEVALEEDGQHAEAGERVLVVDDEPSIRMLVSEALTDLDYAVLEASDGQAGIKILNALGRIDLLITDVGLPGGINGRQLADAARIARPRLPILFITGYAENAIIGHGVLPAGMHVLTKPFSITELSRSIMTALGRET